VSIRTPDPRAEASLPSKRPASLLVIAAVVAGAAMYFAQEVFVPIALGLLFTALFRPLVAALSRPRIPAPVAATLVVVGVLALFGGSIFLLAGPVKEWVSEAPKTMAAARGKLDKIRRPIKQVSQAVEKAQQEVTGGQEKPKQAQPASAGPSPGTPNFLGRVFATTAGVLGTLLQTIVIVFLLLATGDLFSRKLAAVMPRPVTGSSKEAVEEAEAVMRRYLVVTVLLAGGQGVVIALIFMLLGMPSPILWGVLTFVLECIPYLGALIMVAAVTITAFASFDGIGQILLPPLAYITVSTIQNNLISPFAYGSGLRLNALAVLLVVLVGWFLWGPAGAFVAVPLLAGVKVLAERSNRDSTLATVLDE
jgi:predicted PurR-regulated permease PerM